MRIPTSRRVALSGAAATLMFLTGCGGGGSGNPSPSTPVSTGTGRVVPQPNWNVRTPSYQQNQKKWTFLVYMNGANDLEEFGSLNVNQMEQVGSTDDVNIVVQFKRIQGRYDTSNGDWGGTRRYFVTKDTDTDAVNSLLLSSKADADAGKWQTMQEFIQWGLTTYPADHYCLVVWNHGAGWRSVDLNNQGVTRGVSYDKTTENHIDTIELAQAIDMGNNHKWDVLAWDSSLMQMAEVAYEVRDKADFIVGSEESPPGEGYPYQLFLADLAANPSLSGRAFGLDIINKTLESYGTNSNITQSVLDASRVAAIVPAFNALGSALIAAPSYQNAIVLARQSAENYKYPENVDALDFLRLLTTPLPGSFHPPVNDAAVQQAAASLRTTMNSAIVGNVHGTGHPRSNGLAVYLPSPTRYRTIDIDQANGFGQRYSELAFAQASPAWQNFLVNSPE